MSKPEANIESPLANLFEKAGALLCDLVEYVLFWGPGGEPKTGTVTSIKRQYIYTVVWTFTGQYL